MIDHRQSTCAAVLFTLLTMVIALVDGDLAHAQTPTDFYLHGTGPNNNPPTLFLDTTAPTATTAKFRDSASVNFSGGNPWKDIGTWPAASAFTTGTLTALSDLHVWLGLKNSDDQGTQFDLRAEVLKNSTVVVTGLTRCITGITRNPANAKEATVAFGSVPATPFNGTTDVLSLKIFTRIGTNPDDTKCPGHNNAVGLRLYFDATTRNARFDVTIGTQQAPTITSFTPTEAPVGTSVTITGTNFDPVPSACPAGGYRGSEISFFNTDAESSVCMTQVGMIVESMQAPAMADISLITGQRGTLNRVVHCNDPSLHGQRSSVSLAALPRIRWSREPGLLPVTLPSPQPRSTADGGREDIHPCPDLTGRTALEMLMGPEVIIDGSNMLQSSVTRSGIVNGVLHKQPFHGTDEPLDAAVLPRASRIAVLQANAHQSQHHRKKPRREDGFVIGAQESGIAILTAHGDEVVPDRHRRLIRQSLHAQAGAARMVEDGQHHMLMPMRVGLRQQVHAPDQIVWHRAGHAMFQLSAQTEDGVLMPTDRVGDIGFPDGHVFADGEAAVEQVRDRAAARVGHEGFQTNDLPTDPLRFGLGLRPMNWPTRAGTRPAGPGLAS